MPPIVPAIARELARGTRDVLRQGAAVLTGNQGEYIRAGEPESVYGRIQQATARQYCRRYADDPGKFPGGTKVIAENICRPYLNEIGYGSPGSITSPFSGGQCAGVNYAVTARVRAESPYNDLVVQNDITVTRQGPITGVEGRSLSSASICAPSGQPPGSGRTNIRAIRQQLLVRSGDAFTFSPEVGSVDGWGPPVCTLTGSVIFPLDVTTTEVLSIVRVDGLPDNCGSPPPDIVDPVPPPVVGPPLERYNPGPDIDIAIGVEINVDGSVNVDFGTGPITIDPFSDDGSSSGPGDVGEPGAPSDTGPEGDADGEAPPGEVLTGLKINFVTPPVGGNEYREGIYRGVCYIYMGTSDGVDHDPAGAMMRDGQFVFAEKDNLTHWFVSANRGYNLRVTPYYRPAEAEEE